MPYGSICGHKEDLECHFQNDLSLSLSEHFGWSLAVAAPPCLAAAFPGLGIGFAGVALAFGLTVLTMAYAIGHISGCHLNPAVSVGLVVAKRFPASELLAYVIAQVLGGIAGSAVLYFIASGKEGFSLANGFAANGYADHSPGMYSMGACLTAEIVLTFMFLMIILGSTDKRALPGFRADPDRTGTDLDPFDRDSGDQPVRESGPQHRSGDFRGRLGPAATLAVLGGSYCGCRHRGRGLHSV